jgi:hypothetical protein
MNMRRYHADFTAIKLVEGQGVEPWSKRSSIQISTLID